MAVLNQKTIWLLKERPAPHPHLLGGPKGSKNATPPLHSWGSPNKGGRNQKWLPHPSLLGGPKEGGSAMSPVHSRGSPTKGDKSKLAASPIGVGIKRSPKSCPVRTLLTYAPRIVTKCLENGPFKDQKLFKNGSKICYSKDPFRSSLPERGMGGGTPGSIAWTVSCGSAPSEAPLAPNWGPRWPPSPRRSNEGTAASSLHAPPALTTRLLVSSTCGACAWRHLGKTRLARRCGG